MGFWGLIFALLRSIHVVNEFNSFIFFQQGLVYVQEGAASFGNVLGTLNSFRLTACVKMTNDGCIKYYFFFYEYMTLNISARVNAVRVVIFMG